MEANQVPSAKPKAKKSKLIPGIIIGFIAGAFVFSPIGDSPSSSNMSSSYRSSFSDEAKQIAKSDEAETLEIEGEKAESENQEEATAENGEDSKTTPETQKNEPKKTEEQSSSSAKTSNTKASNIYRVISVVDGDTIHIDYNGKDEKVRFIGIDTPEVSDYGGTAECYGAEASSYLKSALNGKTVEVRTDSKTNDRDKYGRLLRYVYLDGRDMGLEMISKGYAEEYTYDVAYDNQSQYRQAQSSAKSSRNGMWGACSSQPTAQQQAPVKQETKSTSAPATQNNNSSSSTNSPSVSSSTKSSGHVYGENGDCNIKGNINKKEKIYHMPGSQSYKVTKIDESKGERWFCSEAEAQAAGWRPRKN